MKSAEQGPTNKNPKAPSSSLNGLYRLLPSVHELLLMPDIARCSASFGHERTVVVIREILSRLRSGIEQSLYSSNDLSHIIDQLPEKIADEIMKTPRYSLRRVINGTGVLLHTNLGRAPLGQLAVGRLLDIAGGYSNLEFNLALGDRGKRDVHVESLLLKLLDSERAAESMVRHRAIVVNNCAGATFLALHALASGKEVLVSRGELVEIGGGFRIPEILEASGAVLREVGATNRTRISDYANSVTSHTGLILRVHQSNFSMDGFVERPGLQELIELGKRTGLPLFEDQGTGLVVSLEDRRETTLADSISKGCDLVAASGDKLLGGPQCGILIGREDLVDRIRKNPLFRALRADKLNYAALEGTLLEYLYGNSDSIPIVRMLRISAEETARSLRIGGCSAEPSTTRGRGLRSGEPHWRRYGSEE